MRGLMQSHQSRPQAHESKVIWFTAPLGPLFILNFVSSLFFILCHVSTTILTADDIFHTYFMLVGLLHIFIFIICMLFWRLVLHYSCGRGYIGIIPKFFSRNPASDPNAKCCWQTCRRRSRFQISQHYFEVLHGNACHLLHIEVNRTNNAYNISLASLVCSKIESTFQGVLVDLRRSNLFAVATELNKYKSHNSKAVSNVIQHKNLTVRIQRRMSLFASLGQGDIWSISSINFARCAVFIMPTELSRVPCKSFPRFCPIFVIFILFIDLIVT